jgi:hypothetical protein
MIGSSRSCTMPRVTLPSSVRRVDPADGLPHLLVESAAPTSAPASGRGVCVESANVGDAALFLDPGRTHELRATVRMGR